jgi:hypothetical protein
MSCSGRDADCFGAGDADFAEMITRSNISDDRFGALSRARIGDYSAAAKHSWLDAV